MKTMKTTDSHNECPNCGGLPIDPRSVNVDADMLFHNNEPVFTYAGEQQQDWRFQRELDAEPECTNTCFDCGHSWRTPKAKKALDRDAVYNRAMTLKEAKRNDEALAAFQEILEQDPNDRDALFGCFSACMHLGEDPAAAVYLRQCLGAE